MSSLDRLRLKADDGTVVGIHDQIEDLHVYESSLEHAETDEPLVSLILTSSRTGIRLTRAQVVELSDWLEEWLSFDVPAADTGKEGRS